MTRTQIPVDIEFISCLYLPVTFSQKKSELIGNRSAPKGFVAAQQQALSGTKDISNTGLMENLTGTLRIIN